MYISLNDRTHTNKSAIVAHSLVFSKCMCNVSVGYSRRGLGVGATVEAKTFWKTVWRNHLSEKHGEVVSNLFCHASVLLLAWETFGVFLISAIKMEEVRNSLNYRKKDKINYWPGRTQRQKRRRRTSPLPKSVTQKYSFFLNIEIWNPSSTSIKRRLYGHVKFAMFLAHTISHVGWGNGLRKYLFVYYMHAW